MDLKTFVEETLCQLADGVVAAQKRLEPLGATVNPYFTADGNGNIKPCAAPKKGCVSPKLQAVDFDVAVTVSEKDSANGGAAISIIGAKLGMDGEKESSSSTVSRIHFQIVVDLPHHTAV